MWVNLSKFKFKSSKNKFNFTIDKDALLSSQLIKGANIEIFSNKKMIIEGCHGIVDYQNDYLKLKLKKGFINIFGKNFLITTFEEEKIVVNGDIVSIEFCV